MDTKFSKPKGFGEILDHTFSLTKNRFKDFFLIILIFMGPVYLLQAIMQLISGTSFFREIGSGNVWFEQILSGFTETETLDTSGLGADIGIIIVGFIGAILGPVAQAAILFAIANIRKNEEYTVGSVIKQAFSRFWPIIGSSILFGIITVMIILIPIIIVTVTAIFGFQANPVLGVLGAILLFLGFAVGIGLLLTRWSFYLGSVVLDKDSPGLERSWRLSRKRTWTLMGLYIVFYLIISAIEFAVQMTFGLALGNSVLLSLISNLATLITTIIFSVGYAVMYLDLKTRHDGDDLKDMIENYNTKTI
ncbi:hypothetical protein [Neobacillus vireti]|uniref:Glycerophosphoryl diester phosphodiesterase membrane domain-containing protein n=1 Tax=Neobacillus vireti LMG 21834 TaxID=1131730 RepID=A0AB94IPD4_9BACI|nr:hypothetical protein [Neobacillus vireti]ETI68872.1 hypothetical protein BAVI_08931 [Neobacillus vireti LMG 21834]KLT15812.1 hypothetical protein AA980_21615 [Neobacillus vireti]